jgi:hypothetical protein
MAMSNQTCFSLTLCTIIAISSAQAKSAEPPVNAVDIRDDAGHVLVAADKIASYDWPTHTLTLAPGECAKLAAELHKNKQLVSGIPFTINIGGKPIYAGKITSLVSSFSLATPVIVIDQKIIEPKVSDDQLRIQLGYPTRQFFQGDDPRGNPQLRTALRAAGKLAKVPPENKQWIADSLLEMQSIKRGMTRAELLQVFESEGGLSGRTQRRYVYRDCPNIKVNVRFEAVGDPDEGLTNAPNDKILEISQPFLEWFISD